MNETFFISDTHFFHRRIIEFEPIARPFKSLDDMHQFMITEWNKVVTPKDTVWHLGDVCFGGVKNLSILKELNGRKLLIKGNHDMYSPGEEYFKYFDRIEGAVEYRGFIMTHIPVHPDQLAIRYTGNIHGHLHSHTMNSGVYVNVSVEQLPNLAPVNFDYIKQKAGENYAKFINASGSTG